MSWMDRICHWFQLLVPISPPPQSFQGGGGGLPVELAVLCLSYSMNKNIKMFTKNNIVSNSLYECVNINRDIQIVNNVIQFTWSRLGHIYE